MPVNEKSQINVNVIYVAGYGRSGSTLLDRLLGAQEGFFFCGELTNIVRAFSSADEYCACHARAQDCPFWQRTFAEWQSNVPDFSIAEYTALQQRYESMRNVWNSTSKQAVPHDSHDRYAQYTRALFHSIARISGASVIVDSSKMPGRALALANVSGLGVSIVHLVRDLRGVVYSLQKAYEKAPEAGLQQALKPKHPLRTAAAWMRTNYICTRICRKANRDHMIIRYEDLASSHESVVQRIATQTGVGPTAKNMKTSGDHQIAGNRMRMKPLTNQY